MSYRFFFAVLAQKLVLCKPLISKYFRC